MDKTNNIGDVIRELRRERHLTQEELAEQLNVTSQAVSKWESGAGLPDISQIVPLANVFGVPTDVLFGRVSTDDAEIERIIEEIEAPLRERMSTEEENRAANVKAYEAYQDTLRIYPNNIRLLHLALGAGNNLADGYIESGEKEKAEIVLNECIREANVIINYSRDTEIVLSARMWLVHAYCNLVQFDKAESELAHFPKSFNLTYGIQREWVLREKNDIDEQIEQGCCNISDILCELQFSVAFLARAYAYYQNDWENAYRVYRVIPDIIDAIYGDAEYTAPLHCVWFIYTKTAICCMKLGRTDEAYEWLEKMAAYCIGNGKHYNKDLHVETPLLREREYEWYKDSYNTSETILDELENKAFDPIRGTERFRALVAKAESFA